MAWTGKGDFADQLGVSRGELENMASSAGFSTTEDYYNSGSWGSGGNNMIDPNQIPSTMDFAMGQEGEISNALNQLVMSYRGLENPMDVWNTLEEASGLPGQKKVAQTLRDQIASLEDTIKKVRPNIKATTRDSMVTEGQRFNMEQAQKRPFVESLQEFGTALGRVDEGIRAMSADLVNKVQLFMKGQEMSLEPFKLQYQSMVDRAARLTSAFGVDAQNQLQVYLTNIQRGWDLADAERDHAWELIQNENSYTQTLEQLAAENGVDISGYDGIDDLLNKIGMSAAEQIAYDRNQDAIQSNKTSGLTPEQIDDINNRYFPKTEEDDDDGMEGFVV